MHIQDYSMQIASGYFCLLWIILWCGTSFIYFIYQAIQKMKTKEEK